MQQTWRQRSILQQMGIDIWVQAIPTAKQAAVLPQTTTRQKSVRPTATKSVTTSVPATDCLNTPAAPTEEGEWQHLRQQVIDCQQCALHQSRQQTVFGDGDEQADWLLIGEAPGAEEDRQGLPFVGKAGKLLNEMLAAIGKQREQVYIANVVKCRPPSNRDPKPEETTACQAYLLRQIAHIQPHIILVLGRVAAQTLLATKTPAGRLRQQTHSFTCGKNTIPLVVTWHPAYLLRKPIAKAEAWADLKYALQVSGENGGEMK